MQDLHLFGSTGIGCWRRIKGNEFAFFQLDFLGPNLQQPIHLHLELLAYDLLQTFRISILELRAKESYAQEVVQEAAVPQEIFGPLGHMPLEILLGSGQGDFGGQRSIFEGQWII